MVFVGAGVLLLALGFGVLVVIALFVIGVYNRLVRTRNQVDQAWAGVQTELQRRYDLIPNLVNTVKGYASHERELLEEVTRLRQDCVNNTGSPAAQAVSESKLQTALGGLMVRLEAYPDLKANQNFLSLQQELAVTEDRLQSTRTGYNGTVLEYNNAIQVFPVNLIAGFLGFLRREFFELENPAAREAPKVSF